ncbi:hypothetical protein F5Y17DRAFT_455795 [Xylariaceae sp. FL0594]|nr:hypothetical protein F5Y17DRAFT_455795 [Xylariaceae sp. FL0594]
MPSPQRHLHGADWLTALLLIVLTYAVTFASASALESAVTPTPGNNNLVRRQAIGSSCAGSEGQWNCMTSSFQRCGSGQWSVVEQCATGTICSPTGLTYEFHVDFANGYIGAAPPPTSGAGGGPTAVAAGHAFAAGCALVNWWFLVALGGLVVQLAQLW